MLRRWICALQLALPERAAFHRPNARYATRGPCGERALGGNESHVLPVIGDARVSVVHKVPLGQFNRREGVGFANPDKIVHAPAKEHRHEMHATANSLESAARRRPLGTGCRVLPIGGGLR